MKIPRKSTENAKNLLYYPKRHTAYWPRGSGFIEVLG
jgi:hypothetical protein